MNDFRVDCLAGLHKLMRDVVGIDVLTERQATHVTAGEALGAQPLHVVFGAFAALCRHREDGAINADVHRIGVHAREVGVKHIVITGAVEVHRHGQWDSGGSGRCTEQLRGESVDVTEWIGMKHSDHLLHVGCRTAPRDGCRLAALLLV